MSEIFFTDNENLIQGIYKSYYNNGQLKEVKHYLNDTLNGEYLEYHPTGNLKIKCFGEKGKTSGDYVEYYQDGSVSLRGVYYRGQDMKMTHFYKDGTIRFLKSYSIPKKTYNSIVYFDKKGLIIDSLSRFCFVERVKDTMLISLPSFVRDRVDSMNVEFVESFSNDIVIKRIHGKSGVVHFKLNENDFLNDTMKLEVNWYLTPRVSNNPNIYYPPTKNTIQIELGIHETPSRFNIDPIY